MTDKPKSASRQHRLRMRRAHAAHVRALIAERFPACFSPKGAPLKRPLKIGIGLDLLLAMPELSAFSIGAALEDYTWGATYCAACVAGAARIDLDGQPDGSVSEAEARHAENRLALFHRFEAANAARAATQQEVETDAP